MTPRLKEILNKEIQPALKEQFGFKNIYMTPRIEKVVLNMGLGLDATDSKILTFKPFLIIILPLEPKK